MEHHNTCLVIEDDLDIRDLIDFVLHRAGYEVRTAVTGAEGIAAAADPSVCLVFLDLGLPDMDGYNAARNIRALTAAPMVFLTARSEPDDIDSGIASGAAGYITKPFHLKDLVGMARRLTAGPLGPEFLVSARPLSDTQPQS